MQYAELHECGGFASLLRAKESAEKASLQVALLVVNLTLIAIFNEDWRFFILILNLTNIINIGIQPIIDNQQYTLNLSILSHMKLSPLKSERFSSEGFSTN